MKVFQKGAYIFGFLFVGIFAAQSLKAQSVSLGGHVGAMGLSEESDIAYGVHMMANPFGFAGFKVDATFTPLESGTFFSSSPAVVFFPVDFAEMKLGLLGGPGFYKIPNDKTRFGLNFGAMGDFSLNEKFSVGMETRYHSIFDVDDAWSVFMTATFHFELEGAW